MHFLNNNIFVSTRPCTAVPAPSNIQFGDVGPSSFVVLWRAPNVRLNGYRVLVTPKNNIAEPKEFNVAPNAMQVTVTGLLVKSLFFIIITTLIYLTTCFEVALLVYLLL